MNSRIISLGGVLARHSQAYTLYSPSGVCPTLAAGEKRYGALPTLIRIIEER